MRKQSHSALQRYSGSQARAEKLQHASRSRVHSYPLSLAGSPE
jgi:hypothetical protein